MVPPPGPINPDPLRGTLSSGPRSSKHPKSLPRPIPLLPRTLHRLLVSRAWVYRTNVLNCFFQFFQRILGQKMKANLPVFPHTRSFEKSMLGLYQSQTLSQLGDAVVELMHELMPIQAAAVFLRPMGFKESLIFARPEYLTMFRMWVREARVVDIWMQRSPPTPGTRLVRHTDHTPDHIFVESEMGKRMKPHNLRFGAAIQIWKRNELLGLIIVDRSESQGDFSNADMRLLGQIYPFVSSAVRRVFALYKLQQDGASWTHAASTSDAGIIVLDSDRQVVEFNPLAVALCARWLKENPRKWKLPHALQIPPEVLQACQELNQADAPSLTELTIRNAQQPDLLCRIRHITIKGPALNSGNFLLRLLHSKTQGKQLASPKPEVMLSPRETELADLVCQGRTNVQAAKELGKSLSTVRTQLHAIFQKLGIKRRTDLARIWAQRKIAE